MTEDEADEAICCLAIESMLYKNNLAVAELLDDYYADEGMTAVECLAEVMRLADIT